LYAVSISLLIIILKAIVFNVWSLYRSGSLKIVSGELAKYKLDLVGVQEVRWDKGGNQQEEIRSRLNSGNACYHAVQNLLSSLLLSINVKIKIYKTIILPVVLYGCESWSLKLREEHRLRVFENRVLSRIFGPKRGEMTGGWRKLHNEELHGLYSSPSIVRVIKARRMRWAGHVARMGR
jgi:hypothetical protein